MGGLFRIFAYSLASVASVAVIGISATTPQVEYALEKSSFLAANAVVGVFAGVPENPYNTLAQQLQAKEDELVARERALQSGSLSEDGAFPFGIASFAVSLGVLVLLAINFILDWRRSKFLSRASMSYSVNLKK